MSQSYSNGFEVAPTVKIGEQTITFPLLNMEDYDPWVSELNQQRRQRSHALINTFHSKAADVDRFRMQRIAEFDEVNLDSISPLVWTPRGARRILDLSLQKVGISDEAERARILQGVRPFRQVQLAAEVSGLFERTLSAQDGKTEDASPNAPGQSPSPTGTSTAS